MPTADITLRPETPEDDASITSVVERAFGRPDEAALVRALRADPVAWIDGLSVVASLSGGTVVGHVLLSRMSLAGFPALALAPVSVDPAWKGKGIGTELTTYALALAAAAGEQYVIVLGDPAYYSRFGFAPAHTHGIENPFEGSGDAFQALALDGSAMPTGAVHYSAPFN